MTKSVVFSPHCDDAFLSLGGAILQAPDEYQIVDIFATCAWTTTEENYTSDELTRINQAEERSVATDAGVDLVMYEYPEALLRNYKKWNTKRLHDSDRHLSDDILKDMRNHLREVDRVFFPTAPGNHVDHVIVHSQLPHLYQGLVEAGVEVYLYEDLPYSWYGDLDDRLTLISKRYTLVPTIIDISDVYLRKEKLLESYTSQLGEDELRKVREYGRSLVKGKYSERIWRVLSK